MLLPKTAPYTARFEPRYIFERGNPSRRDDLQPRLFLHADGFGDVDALHGAVFGNIREQGVTEPHAAAFSAEFVGAHGRRFRPAFDGEKSVLCGDPRTDLFAPAIAGKR